MRRPALRLVRTSSRCLLARAQDDVEVFAEFYDAYYDSVLRFLARRVFDPELAFDLLSETFAKALERRAQFRGSSAAEEQAWLFSIARTEISHYWRSGKVEQAAVARFAITVPTLTESEHERIESLAGLSALGSQLADALLALPPTSGGRSSCGSSTTAPTPTSRSSSRCPSRLRGRGSREACARSAGPSPSRPLT